MPPDTGTIDRDYRPSAKYAGWARYAGCSKIADIAHDVSTIDVILSPELQRYQAQGKLTIRTAGPEGGDSTSYFCRAKPGRLKVSIAKKARLACELDKLLCKDDNPPGSTCLGDAFVSESEQGASLRLTYLEHWGVNVREREDKLGGSTSWSRSKTRVSASWSGNDLELKYRAGITYTGSLKLADGRSQTLKCNDLAMLD